MKLIQDISIIYNCRSVFLYMYKADCNVALPEKLTVILV